MDAEAFLARLRARQRTTTVDVEVPSAPPAREAPSFKRFGEELVRVGGHWAEVSRADLVPRLTELASSRQLRSFICWPTPWLQSLEVSSRLNTAGLERIEYPEDPSEARRTIDRAQVGIVEADLAISESGTVGLLSDRQRGRLVSALPRVLIVLIEPSRLLGRLDDVPAWLSARGELPSSLSLVTGPSRTGDIEAKLVIGAHGPAELYVLLVSDRPSEPGK